MRKSKRPARTVFKSIYGTVRVYIRRHLDGCDLSDPNDTHCNCPKWLYSKARGGRAVQKAAGTPSFTEACGQAQRLLKGFDPEIAKAREITEPKLGITIQAALQAYKTALERRSLTPKYISNCLSPIQRRKASEYTCGRAKNKSLLDWLDGINAPAREPVVRMEQLVSNYLDEWSASWKTNDSSTHLWRGKVTMFLKWCRKHDHLDKVPEFREPHRVRSIDRCGYFSDEQIAKLRAAIPFFRLGGGRPMPQNFAARMSAFLDAGREGGMAICDIVNFSPRLSLSAADVLVYRRHKTDQWATVLLEPAAAKRLRQIPPEEGSDPDRPFRFPGTDEEVNRERWRSRLASLCRFAGVTEIEGESGKHKPHPHALRDSLAISAITNGVSLENVAKMLGHANTQMVQKSYLPWIKRRLDHCIADQRLGLLRRAQAATEAESPESEVQRPTIN